MTSDEHYPVGTPVPRSDSFEILEPAGPELTDEEKAWPVVALQPRSDSFEVIGQPSKAGELEVVIRVRCAASATPAEVSAFVGQLGPREKAFAHQRQTRSPCKSASPLQRANSAVR